VKHWFRNTLFKERQRCKDSPYNFNVPPATSNCDQPPVSSSLSVAAPEKAVAESSAFSALSAYGHLTVELGARPAGEESGNRDVLSTDGSTMPAETRSSKFCSPSSSMALSQSSSTFSAASPVTPAPPQPQPVSAEAPPPYFPHTRGCYFGMPVPPYPPAVPQALSLPYVHGSQALSSYHLAVPQALPLLSSVVGPVVAAGPGPANVGVGSVGVPHIVNVTSTGGPSVAPVGQAHHPATTTTTSSRGGHGKRASRTHFSDEQVGTRRIFHRC